jgi:hypothetical protein
MGSDLQDSSSPRGDKETVPERWEMFNPKDNLSIRQRLYWLYFQFTLVTCTFMLDPWERRLADVCFFCIFAMTAYACYAYLPGYGIHLYRLVASLIFPHS